MLDCMLYSIQWTQWIYISHGVHFSSTCCIGLMHLLCVDESYSGLCMLAITQSFAFWPCALLPVVQQRRTCKLVPRIEADARHACAFHVIPVVEILFLYLHRNQQPPSALLILTSHPSCRQALEPYGYCAAYTHEQGTRKQPWRGCSAVCPSSKTSAPLRKPSSLSGWAS